MYLYSFSAMMNKKYVTINAIFITGDTTTAAPKSGNIQIILLTNLDHTALIIIKAFQAFM